MSILGIESINPHLRVALRSELPKGTAIAPRVIFDYELIFIERGEFIFGYGGRSYRVSEGSFLLISPGVTHSFDCSLSDISQPHIHFDMTYSQASRERFICYKDLPDLTAKERELISEDILPNGREPFVIFESTDAPKELLFSAIDAHSRGDELLAKGLLTALIHHVLKDNFPNTVTGESRSFGIEDQIRTLIDSGNAVSLSLCELEKRFSYSRFHLERLFREKFGIGIIAYRNEARLTAAKELLRTKSVTEVAYTLGYSSIYSFSRAYKNKFGISPSEVSQQQPK